MFYLSPSSELVSELSVEVEVYLLEEEESLLESLLLSEVESDSDSFSD